MNCLCALVACLLCWGTGGFACGKPRFVRHSRLRQIRFAAQTSRQIRLSALSSRYLVVWRIEQFAAQIFTTIPLVWDDASGSFTAPTDPVLLKLYKLVTQKQMHVCRHVMCRAGASTGFPMILDSPTIL